MARGVPVACSSHPCLKEVLGESACYFDASRPENIAKAAEVLLNDQELREKMVKKGYEQVKKYNWEEMAETTLMVYQNARCE
jgi:glycosyltransferase involved in cell wall biosynthesis